jgi:hypothetical protein
MFLIGLKEKKTNYLDVISEMTLYFKSELT